MTAWKSVVHENETLEAQLRQAQKMESIGTLAGGIAHDFNNMLMAIVGNVDLALTSLPDDAAAIPVLKRVLSASDRAKNLVQQILAFSRKTETEFLPTSIATLAEDTTSFLRASMPVTIELKLDIQPDMHVIMADATGIHQVLLNLCTNAMQAIEDDRGQITVTCQTSTLDNKNDAALASLKPGKYQTIAVADTGKGMDEATQERIFDPFFTTKAVGKGTGLGLSVVHGIVQNHGGDILVESKPGTGSVFTVYLPELTISAMPTSPAVVSAESTHGEHVLYVDDEPGLVELGKIYLEQHGYIVSAFESSERALAYFKQNPEHFDCVVTDSTMPGLTGFELASTVLQLRSDIPIVMMSGFVTESMESKAAQIGIRAMLQKPLSGRDITSQIRTVLDNR